MWFWLLFFLSANHTDSFLFWLACVRPVYLSWDAIVSTSNVSQLSEYLCVLWSCDSSVSTSNVSLLSRYLGVLRFLWTFRCPGWTLAHGDGRWSRLFVSSRKLNYSLIRHLIYSSSTHVSRSPCKNSADMFFGPFWWLDRRPAGLLKCKQTFVWLSARCHCEGSRKEWLWLLARYLF